MFSSKYLDRHSLSIAGKMMRHFGSSVAPFARQLVLTFAWGSQDGSNALRLLPRSVAQRGEGASTAAGAPTRVAADILERVCQRAVFTHIFGKCLSGRDGASAFNCARMRQCSICLSSSLQLSKKVLCLSMGPETFTGTSLRCLTARRSGDGRGRQRCRRLSSGCAGVRYWLPVR